MTAIDAIQARWGHARVSRFYQTPAFPRGSGPDFVNAACVFDTSDAAEDVLATLHAIETQLGRKRTLRWGPRTLDLDLIGCGNSIEPNLATFELWRTLSFEQQEKSAPDQLILPHPRVQDRAFVLVPLADVAPEWVHPVLNKTTLQMLADCDDADRKSVVEIKW